MFYVGLCRVYNNSQAETTNDEISWRKNDENFEKKHNSITMKMITKITRMMIQKTLTWASSFERQVNCILHNEFKYT